MTPASADHCASNIFIHSYIANAISPPFGIMCILDPGGHDVDWRLINPGAESILVQYLIDQGAAVPAMEGVLAGLGFDNEPLTLNRYQIPGGVGYAYQSEILAIPDGPTASGCLVAAVTIAPGEPDIPPETNSFHTIDSSCPDF